MCNEHELSQVVDQVALKMNLVQDTVTLRILVSTLLTCLQRFYQKQMKDEARITIKLINSFPDRSDLVLEKLLAKYYLNLLNENMNSANDIVEILKQAGYEKFLDVN